jgi:hypothetical protein
MLHAVNGKQNQLRTKQNIKTIISVECEKENKQNKLTAKHFKANMMEEQAEATEDLIATLTEMHSCQIETLIKSTTDAMKEMMILIKENKNPTNSSKTTNKERKKKREKIKKGTMTQQFAKTAERNTL